MTRHLSLLGIALALASVTPAPVGAAPGEASLPEAPTTPPEAAAVWLDSDGDGLSDGFEERWGATRSATADSDGDGLIDAGEDLDGDDLGGLGEQRYGTHPLVADSDGDGIADGDEDSDRDGISDAQQQDQRRLPRDLRPTTQMAWWDRPSSYDDRCHNDAVDAELHPCRFAAAGRDVQVALFGDSHALQWLPALVEAGLETGWGVVALTKAACPPAQVEFARKEAGAGESCLLWRDQALDWLREDPPSVVILSGAGRAYKLIDAEGERIPDEEALADWQQGLAATLRALPRSTSVVVLADTPLMGSNPVSCLDANPADVSACLTPRSMAIGSVLDEAERDIAEAAGATFESLNELVCPYSPCPVVMGDVLMWRNADHITVTFAQLLAPSMRDLVVRNLPAAGGGAGPGVPREAATENAGPDEAGGAG